MARDDEVMIQDVNPLNAKICFDGYMYVGGRRHSEKPRFFAPCFTKACEATEEEMKRRYRNDWKLLTAVYPDAKWEPFTAGVGYYIEVIHVPTINVHDLIDHPESAIDDQIRKNDFWRDGRWQRGLEKISLRARKEKGNPQTPKAWSDEYDPHRLYFLGKLGRLDRGIEKRANFPRIPWGFGMSLHELKSRDSLP